MKRMTLLSLVLCTTVPQAARAQDVLDDVFLFRNLNQDARVASGTYLAGHAFRSSFETVSYSYVGMYVGLPLSPKFQVATGLEYFWSDPEFGDGTSGITDLFVHGKYNFSVAVTRLSAGAFVTAPIGSEEIGEGDVDVGVFVAARHPLAERTVLSGKASLDHFGISEDDTDPSFRLHGGVIQQASEQLALIGELLINTGVTTVDISAGVNYALSGAGSLRGALGVGLNENSPDLTLMLGYVHQFARRND